MEQMTIDDSANSQGLTVAGIALLLVRAAREISWTWLTLVAVLAALLLPQGRRWESEARVTNESRRLSSNMLSLAVRLGVSVNGNEVTNSPQFFADLVLSREILGAIAKDTFAIGSGAERRTGTLEVLYKISGATPEIRREYLIRRLLKDVESRVELKTGVVVITVRSPDPVLSAAMCRRLISLVDQFNQVSRRSQARNERVFTEGRLKQVESELRNVEDSLRSFVMANREYQSSPSLLLEYQRRARRVELQQTVFTSLTQSFEQARIDEVRDTPVLTTVQSPEVSALPLPRGLLRKSALLILVAMPLGAFIALQRRREAVYPSGVSDAEAVAEIKLRARRFVRR